MTDLEISDEMDKNMQKIHGGNSSLNWNGDWENNSFFITRFAPKCFDKDKFNWEKDSSSVVEYCPQHFDKDKFNWEYSSSCVARYAPYLFCPKKYNWERYSIEVLQYCPENIDLDRINLKHINVHYPMYTKKTLQDIKTKAILQKL